MKLSKPKLSTAKKKAAKAFQLWVRLRDSDGDGYGSCCTCGKRVHYKEADAGHWISRKYSATLFSEANCHLQCKGCNGFNNPHHIYRKFLVNKYGEKVVQDMEMVSGMICKRTVRDYQLLEQVYKQRISELMKGKG